MMTHAVEIGLRADDPTRDVKALRSKSLGHHSWEEREIEHLETRHPIGSKARLAFALLLYTGQRRSDVVRMGRQHIREGLLHVRFHFAPRSAGLSPGRSERTSPF